MAYLNKEQILNADDIPTEDCDVPEWGGTVKVRGLSGNEVDAYEQSILKSRRKGGGTELALQNATARLVAWCVVDENNSRLFINESEVKELGKKSSSALQRCFEVASRLSGLRDGDVEAMVESFPSDS